MPKMQTLIASHHQDISVLFGYIDIVIVGGYLTFYPQISILLLASRDV